MLRLRSILTAAFLILGITAGAQTPLDFRAPQVRTLCTHVEGDETSFPIIGLDSNDHIVVEFDCLSDTPADLEYSLQHCFNCGTPTDLLPTEYIEGFNVNPVTDYWPSVSTMVGYYNYRITLPNDNVRMLLSGRYVLNIFEAGHPDKVIARTSFLVYEQLVTIDAEIRKPERSDRTEQEVRLSIDANGLPLNNVLEDLKVDIVQNGCPYTSRTALKPKYIAGDKLIYAQAGDLLIPGGNEFRRLDLRYLRQAPINYNTVEFIGGTFHVTTPPDEIRAFKPYFTEEDQNGQFVVYANQVNKSFDDFHRSADYAFAHPTLTTEPVLDGDVFVCGAFNNWLLDSTNMMRYNFSAKRYEADLLLKQGVYDYIYVCRSYYNGAVDTERFEGSHAETENRYVFLVFYYPAAAEYEQLVGVAIID